MARWRLDSTYHRACNAGASPIEMARSHLCPIGQVTSRPHRIWHNATRLTLVFCNFGNYRFRATQRHDLEQSTVGPALPHTAGAPQCSMRRIPTVATGCERVLGSAAQRWTAARLARKRMGSAGRRIRRQCRAHPTSRRCGRHRLRLVVIDVRRVDVRRSERKLPRSGGFGGCTPAVRLNRNRS